MALENMLTAINSLGRIKLLLSLAIIAGGAVTVLLLAGGTAPQNQQSADSPAQTPLPINTSAAGSGLLQADGVDLQSSAAASSAINPSSSSPSSVQSNASTGSTPNQPPTASQDPTYPKCYSCTPGPGKECPLIACPESE